MVNILNAALQCKRFRFNSNFFSRLPDDINLSDLESSFHILYNQLHILQAILHILHIFYNRLPTIIYCSENCTAHVSDPMGSRKIRRKQVCRRKTSLRNFRLRKFFLIGEIAVFCTPSIYPPPCTLPSTVYCPYIYIAGLPLRCTLLFAY